MLNISVVISLVIADDIGFLISLRIAWRKSFVWIVIGICITDFF